MTVRRRVNNVQGFARNTSILFCTYYIDPIRTTRPLGFVRLLSAFSSCRRRARIIYIVAIITIFAQKW